VGKEEGLAGMRQPRGKTDPSIRERRTLHRKWGRSHDNLMKKKKKEKKNRRKKEVAHPPNRKRVHPKYRKCEKIGREEHRPS